MENVNFVEVPPTTNDFLRLREDMGWGLLDIDSAARGLAASVHCACIYHNNNLVAMGRIVGDGAIYFYIQDVMVSVPYQGRGFGRMIMDNIMKFIHLNATENATIGLMSAKGKEGFYQKYGFILRPNNQLGAGMCLFVQRK